MAGETAIFALVVIVTLSIVWLVLRHLRYCRDLTHAERMQALTAGQMLVPETVEPERRYLRNASLVAFCLGAIVPVVALWAAAWISHEGLNPPGQIIAVWCSIGATCLASVICSAVVMLCAAVVTMRPSQARRMAKPKETPPES